MAFAHAPTSMGTPTVALRRDDRDPRLRTTRARSPAIDVSVEETLLSLSPGEALALVSDLRRALDDLAADPPAAWGPQQGYGEMTADQAARAARFLEAHEAVIAIGTTADGRMCGYLDRDNDAGDDCVCATVAFRDDGEPYLLVRPEDQHQDGAA